MAEQIHIFDRKLLRARRDRAADHFSAAHRVVHEESAAHLLERIGDVKRDFQTILDLGASDAHLAEGLSGNNSRFVVAADLSGKMLHSGRQPNCVVGDEELLPFAKQSFDLVVSNLSLNWVNDLPGAFVQIRESLRPEGMFLAAVLGGQTLYELRACLMDAELAITGGVSPRLSPNIDMQTASALLQRAGFKLPVTDHELMTLAYSDIYALMHDLRGMAQTNVHRDRLKKPTRRAVFDLAGRLYKERFGGNDGRIPASFDVIFMHGWT